MRTIFFIYILSFSIFAPTSTSFGAYLPSGGNNNDIQYKNGLGFAGSDNLVFNGSNVGIGSITPGQALDVKGTVRMTGFNLSASPASGDILTSDASGNFSWVAPGSLSYWLNTAAAGNVGLNTTNTVGIGTSSGIGAGLVVMNGNVGIGTWSPADFFQVGAYNTSSGGFEIDSNGNVGLGTTLTTTSALSVMSGNVGIGTWLPAAAFQVGIGTFSVNTSSGNIGIGTALAQRLLEIYPRNNVTSTIGLMSTGSAGDEIFFGTNGSYTGVGGNNAGVIGYNQAVNGGMEFRTALGTDPNTSGNTRFIITLSGVGINTITPSSTVAVLGGMGIGSTAYASTYSAPATGLIVQGNVGIGTWTPADLFQVGTYNSSSSGLEIDSNGNVGLGTTLTSTAALSVMDGNVGIGTWVPADLFQVGKYVSYASGLEVDANGNVGMGTTITSNAPLSIIDGNVGIGTWVTQASLDLTKETDAVILPSGTTAQEPAAPVNGMVRYNSTIPWVESYQKEINVGIGSWMPINGMVTLCNSSTASATETSSSETNLGVCTIPAGVMGTNGRLEINFVFKFVGSSNTKTVTVRFSTSSGDTSAGTAYFQVTTTTALYDDFGSVFNIWNTNSASAQTGSNNSIPTGWGQSISAITTSSINTANASYINFNCDVTNSADSCQLVQYTVMLYQQM